MSPALLELLVRNLRGRVVRWVRLLRQPKYLLAFVASVIYFGWLFGFRILSGFSRARDVVVPAELATVLRLAVALAFAAGLTLIWVFTSSKPALRLTESEIHLLLPAPLTRREIVLFALLKEQAGVLFGALVFSLFRGGLSPGQRLLGFFAAWALLALADLHIKGVSLWKARLREMPRGSSLLRLGLAAGLAIAWWTAIFASLYRAWVSVFGTSGLDLRDMRRALQELVRAAEAGLLDELLAPFVWMSESLLGSSPGPRLAGLLFLLLAIAVHVEWAVRSRARFEEATLERARRELDRKSKRRGREPLSLKWRTREPFRLAPAGRPETAILWKNLMLRGRMPLRTQTGLAAAAALLAAVLSALFGGPASGVTATAGLFLLCFMPIFAGVMLRHDLRADLLHVEILRTWPLPARRLVLAEMMAPAVSALLLQLLGCGLLLAALLGDRLGSGGPQVKLLSNQLLGGMPEGAMVALLLPCMVLVGMSMALLSISLQNLAVLLLPGWIGLGMERQRGTAMTGHHLLLGIAHLLAITLAALPSALGAAAVAAVLHLLLDLRFTLWEIPLFAVVAALPLLLATGLVVHFASRAWERLDPSQEILEAQA